MKSACDRLIAKKSVPTLRPDRERETRHAAARTLRLFGDRRPAAAQAAGRRAARVLDHRQLRGLGHRQADGAAGAAGADRRSRCCPTCRTGAGTNTACGSAPGASSSCIARLGIRPTLAINARVCEDYPRVAEEAKRDGWEFMGHSYEQGPIHKEPDQAAMIERSLVDHRALHRHAPGRLARAGPDADARHARTARRRRHQIHRRLGLRRRADHDPHRQRPAGHAALHGRAQRHPDDDRAAPRERLSAQARDRPVRPALRREAQTAPRSWRSRSTPTSAASRTGSNTSKRSTTTCGRFDGVLHWNGVEILDWYSSVARLGRRRAQGAGALQTSGLRRAGTRQRVRPLTRSALFSLWNCLRRQRRRRCEAYPQHPPENADLTII